MCANILENAKEVFQSKIDQAKKVIRGKSPGQVLFFVFVFFVQKFQAQKLYFNIFNIWTPQALQVLKRSSSSTSNSPLIVKKSCVIKSGLGRPNTDLILVNKAGRPVRESFMREKNDFNVLRFEGREVNGRPDDWRRTRFLSWDRAPTRLLALVRQGGGFT